MRDKLSLFIPSDRRYFFSPENNLITYLVWYLNFGYSVLLQQWLSNLLVLGPLYTLRNNQDYKTLLFMWVTMFDIKTEKCLKYSFINSVKISITPLYVNINVLWKITIFHSKRLWEWWHCFTFLKISLIFSWREDSWFLYLFLHSICYHVTHDIASGKLIREWERKWQIVSLWNSFDLTNPLKVSQGSPGVTRPHFRNCYLRK